MTDFDTTLADQDNDETIISTASISPDIDIPEIDLGSIIGKGGAGVVYKGRQPYLNRNVAVKILNIINPATDSRFNERFQREAQILAELVHPNIVACYQAGITKDQQPYIAMEFIDGPTLEDYLGDQNKISVPLALNIVLHISEALKYAYDNKIIHRDIKAENILLKPDTVGLSAEFKFIPKLADLGIARSTEIEPEDNLTAVGMVIGTPNSMAPEQFNSPAEVDFHADIYGLGCILYQALTGHKPFSGKSLIEILAKKMDGDYPDPGKYNDQINKPVSRLIKDMLAPAVADRPESYRKLTDQCKAFLSETGTNIAPQKSGHKKSSPAIFITVAGVLVIAAAGFWISSDQQEEVADQADIKEIFLTNDNPDTTETAVATDLTLGTERLKIAFTSPPLQLISKTFGAPLENWGTRQGSASWITEDEGDGVNGVGVGEQYYINTPDSWRLTGSMALLTTASREAGVRLVGADNRDIIFSLKQLGKIYLSIAEDQRSNTDASLNKLTSVAFIPLDIKLLDQQSFSISFTDNQLQFQVDDQFIGSLQLEYPINNFALFVDNSTASFRALELLTVQ